MKKCILLACLTLSSNLAFANSLSFQEWVQALRQQAVAEGVNPTLFDKVFATIHEPDHKTLSLDRKQPEKRLTYLNYRNTRSDAYRIRLGQKEYRKNQSLLGAIGQQYGVDPCTIAALWGIETSYGHYMGNFPVVQSLATLAYDDRRGDKFREEVIIALKILQEGHVSMSKFKGEWAGASGIPQFLPSSWQKFAVDYDGDGRKDIWTSYPDAFASIANYLVKNGWQSGQSWGVEVSAPNVNPSLIGKDKKMPLSEWVKLGVTPINGFQFPNHNPEASLITPDGGPDLLVFNNYKTLLRYNNSTYYAGTVSYLADKICQRR